jgi:hypothetical protein
MSFAVEIAIVSGRKSSIWQFDPCMVAPRIGARVRGKFELKLNQFFNRERKVGRSFISVLISRNDFSFSLRLQRFCF